MIRYSFTGAKRAKPRKRSKSRKKGGNIMAKAKREKKPVSVEAAGVKISTILAPFSKDQRKSVVKNANKILRLVSKLGVNGAK